MILLIDNYDSFTYNLAQILWTHFPDVKVIKNDELTPELIFQMKDQIKAFMLSPGPGHPKQAHLCRYVVETFQKTHPILGVCLGHQVIAEVFGAQIVSAKTICHGKASAIEHDSKGCFQNLKNPLSVVRYHSLAVESSTLPKNLLITAQSKDGEIMGLRHSEYAIEGVQFHPESALTEQGETMVLNFFDQLKLT